jgi:Zn-finger nucleic acid-binding protein
MKERSFLVECHYCDVEVEIYCETEMTVDYCPFCGEENNALELDSDEY